MPRSVASAAVIPPLEPATCDVNSRYRTISGRCNNLDNPDNNFWVKTSSKFVIARVWEF
jgi:hypothetical protein